MRYVMVPVPTEHVLDVMRWVLFRAPEEELHDAVRDAARIATVLAEADDLRRSLLGLVAAASLRNESLKLRDVADELEVEAGALHDVVGELNATALGPGRPLIAIQVETAVGVTGNVGKVSYLGMRPELARLVRKAATAPDATPE
jgi:hypothetical protein